MYRITIDTLRGQRTQEFQTRPAARHYVASAASAMGFQSATVNGPDGTVLLDADDVGEWLQRMRRDAEPTAPA